jgi:predicted O-linked N-acetylglucosamine transferase (SPINDLY family)
MKFAGTSGLDCVDYVVTDENAVPAEDDCFYTERVRRLPCGANGAFLLPGTQGARMAESHVPVAPLPCKKKGFVTFGSFNATFKLSDESLGAWADILQQVPRSRLLLKSHFFARRRICKKVEEFFTARGVAPERLTVEGNSPVSDMWRRYGDVDIALDTMPYTGGSTTLHALWQGVPVIHAARQGLARADADVDADERAPRRVGADRQRKLCRSGRGAGRRPQTPCRLSPGHAGASA